MTTPRDPTHDEQDERDGLAADYVLGALAAEEVAAFERRLAAEPALAQAVDRLRATLGLMPLATVTAPPPHLRARVLNAAAALDAPAAHGTIERPRPRAAPSVRVPRRVVWSRFAAGAAAVLAVGFGVDAYRARSELALQRELTATLQEPNVVRSFALAGAGGAYGTVALDLDAKRGAAVLKNLRTLSAGERYRLWAQVGERSAFCGEFQANPSGGIVAQFVVPVESYTAPIARLFLTKESTPRAETPAGSTVMEST